MKRIILLGSTGSIGTNTLDVIRQNPDLYNVVGLAAHRNAALLEKQAAEFSPEAVSLTDPAAASQCTACSCRVFSGTDAPVELVKALDADIVLAAMSGAAGLPPVLAAIQTGKHIALANKETLVTAGSLVMKEAASHNISIIPVDSEHSAVFQSLQAGRHEEIDFIILTASGGALRDTPPEKWDNVTPEQALAHPNWDMGPKVTIDSASLMNKALEIIEAHWLFDLPPEKIKVLIHHESIVHSMVQFCDGSIIAQLGPPDMRFPIQYALTWPDRAPSTFPRLDLAETGTLHFKDATHYRNIDLAYQVLEQGGTAGTIFNAANEIAVEAFLNGQIKFTSIADIVSKVLGKIRIRPEPGLADVFEADRQTRELTRQEIDQL